MSRKSDESLIGFLSHFKAPSGLHSLQPMLLLIERNTISRSIDNVLHCCERNSKHETSKGQSHSKFWLWFPTAQLGINNYATLIKEAFNTIDSILNQLISLLDIERMKSCLVRFISIETVWTFKLISGEKKTVLKFISRRVEKRMKCWRFLFWTRKHINSI